MHTEERVFIAIGSNLGRREENLGTAIALLSKKCGIVKKSLVRKTEPIGFREQPLFLNQTIEVKTELEPKELLLFLKGIEKEMGRAGTIRNGPRIIDLDIIFYGGRIVKEENLEIPHPRMHERKFVLEPLADIAPEFVHPVKKKSIEKMLKEA